jgi:hypothetical protein
MTRLRKWVRESFAKQNIKFDFSDHFMDRLDDRSSGLSMDDVARLFAQIITTDSVRKAFDVLSNKSNIDQTRRVIDFKLNGSVGSIFIIKSGRNQYTAETFYHGGLLSQAPRTREQQHYMMNVAKAPSDQNKCPSFNLGTVSDDDIMTMIRKSREQNIPGEQTNVYGNDSTKSLTHRQSTKVFTVINAHVMMTIDSLRKAVQDRSKGIDTTSKIQYLAEQLISTTTLFTNNRLISSDERTVIVNDISKMISGTTAQTTAISYALKKTFSSAITQIRNRWNISRDILRVAAYDAKNPGTIQSTSSSSEILKKLNSSPEIQNDDSISITKFVNTLRSNPSQIKNSSVNQAYREYSNTLTVSLDIANQMKVTTSSVSGQELSPTDTKQASNINQQTGRLNSATGRRTDVTKQRLGYNQQTAQLISANRDRYIKGLLAQPQTNSEAEQDIRGLLNDALNPTDYQSAISMIADIIKSDRQPNQFTKTVAKYLPTLTSISTQPIKENDMRKTPVSKYVAMLIADLKNPKIKQSDPDYDIDLSVDEHRRLYDPSLKIPQQDRYAALTQAFRLIIDSVKKKPEMLEYIVNAQIPWIPLSVQHKMEDLLDELDKLDAKMSNKANTEKPKYKKVDEASKYLGPTTKVKIDKRGMQTPLNKRGFGV